MDDLLLKVAELVDPEITVEVAMMTLILVNDIDPTVVEASRQFNTISPPTAKRVRVHSKQSDRFAAVATTS